MAMRIDRSIEARARRKPHLFLCHSSNDKNWVHKLAGELNMCEVDVWLDEWELRIGDKLALELGDAVERSRYLAILISGNFHKSDWGRTELELALAKEKRENRVVVLPLLVGRAKLPDLVKDRLYLDFRKNRYHALSRLVGLLRDLSATGLDAALKKINPSNLQQCFEVLRYVGHEPYALVDDAVFKEIVLAGGTQDGDRIHFEPERILQHPQVSPMTKDWVRGLPSAVEGE